MNKSNKFSPEVRERAVRLVHEHRGEYPSLWAAVESIAPKIGCVPQTLLEWVKRQEVDGGQHVFRPGGARPPFEELKRYIDRHRSPYGTDKVWKQMSREGIAVARCTVERLMKRLGLRGVRRGKSVRTTMGDANAPCPLDRVNRQFKADRPNQLWVSDFTYVSTWQGWQYVAFVIDVYARRIVGWRQSSSMRTDFVLDALEQALYDRQPQRDHALIHHGDRGSQYVSIRYSERLAEAGIGPSVGSRGDSGQFALKPTLPLRPIAQVLLTAWASISETNSSR
jgi:putative transposase